MQLALYGNRFTLYGRPLVLYDSTPTPPDGFGGGGPSQLPHLRVDRYGRPVTDEPRQRQRAKTVRESIDEELDRARKPVEKTDEIKPKRPILTVKPPVRATPDIAAPNAAIQAQIDAAIDVAELLRMQWLADDELAAEILLLSM